MSITHRIVVLALVVGTSWLGADTVQLRGGRIVDGTFMGGDTRQVRIMTPDGNMQSFDIRDVELIQFQAPVAAAPPPPPRREAPVRYQERRQERVAAAPRAVVPAGTVLTVRMIDSIDSDVAGAGERFRASLDTPLQVGEEEVAPRGSDVTVQLTRVQQSGKITGRDELSMDLYDVTINGRKYPVATSYAEVSSASRGARSAKVIGGTAAVGAIIGAIAGGGQGAAIGAGAGAGAGTAAQVLTKGQRVKIAPETRLDFTLKQNLVVD
jgi:hypothetical protein